MAEGSKQDNAEEWERRLVTGDLPSDFLEVTEPKPAANSTDQVTAQATAITSTFDRSLKPQQGSPVSPPGVNNTVATGSLLDLGEDIPTPPDHHQQTMVPQGTGQGRDPSQSANVEEQSEGNGRPMSTEEKDHAMALALQKQLNLEGQQEAAAREAAFGGYVQASSASLQPPPNAQGRLTVTVAEAKLARNYGMTRMDPYCRVRVGHCVYETPTCANGAREPKWNKTFNCYLLAGVKRIDIEIYDECTFQADALIAHASFDIPESVTGPKNEVVDEWWPLSGQEGHEKEGMLHLILSLQPLPPSNAATGNVRVISAQSGQQVRIATQPGGGSQATVAAAATTQQQQQMRPPEMSEEQLAEFSKMFPNVDKEVIVSVFQENRGNQENTVTGLLLLSGGS